MEEYPTAVSAEASRARADERASRREKGIAESESPPAHRSTEMKMSVSGSGCKKRPPSRLQKHAPASLQLERAAAGAGTGAAPAVWGDGRAPIPLLSPLVVSPSVPVWGAEQAGAARNEGGEDQLAEGRTGAEQQQQRGAARHGGSGGERQAHGVSPRPPAPAVGAGWRHPALLTPVAEPASLVPLFQSQCALEVSNAQQ